MFSELGRKLVEVAGELDLTAQRSERFGDGTAAPHGQESGYRAARAQDHDLLPALRKVD